MNYYLLTIIVTSVLIVLIAIGTLVQLTIALLVGTQRQALPPKRHISENRTNLATLPDYLPAIPILLSALLISSLGGSS